MLNLPALITPRIIDQESFQKFVEDLEDLVPGIERDVAALRRDPTDRGLIARLFRAIHTIKGDAALCKVEVGAIIVHPIESLLARCREGEVRFSHLLAEVVLLTLDRLDLVIEALGTGRDTSTLNLPQLVGGIEGIAKAPAAEIPQRAAEVIEAVTGFRPVNTGEDSLSGPDHAHTTDHNDDLEFFRSLAHLYEARSPLFKGRTDRILRLALATNEAAGSPVDATQLEAAVLMHDVGMMFAPESVWLKTGRLSDEDRCQLHAHPRYSAGLLERMPGWEVAARMVREHHEMPDGRGYPLGLKNDAICAGAKILAIVDAFEAVTLKHSNQGQTRSLVRAIAEVNACDKQFAVEWIGPFNTVIRRMLEA